MKNSIHHIGKIFAITIFFSFTIPGKSQSRLPFVILKTTDGEEVRLSDYAALKKPLVISFWATYFGPCLEEFETVKDIPFCFVFNSKGVYTYRHAGFLPGDELILIKELKKFHMR